MMTFEIIFISFKKVRVFIFDLNSIFADFFFQHFRFSKISTVIHVFIFRILKKKLVNYDVGDECYERKKSPIL